MFRKKLKHKHNWKLIHSKLFIRSYTRKSLFSKPYQIDVECVAKLYKCSECGKESANIWSDIFKGESHIELYTADSWGEIDPLYYRLKFMNRGKKESP